MTYQLNSFDTGFQKINAEASAQPSTNNADSGYNSIIFMLLIAGDFFSCEYQTRYTLIIFNSFTHRLCSL